MDNNLLTTEDVIDAVDTLQAELHFLRFIYNWFKEHCSDGGTDELFWATEQYEEENGTEAPKAYRSV